MNQSQYHRISNSLANLRIRIRLKKVDGVHPIAKKQVGSGTPYIDALEPGSEIFLVVKWQEKVPGPNEISQRIVATNTSFQSNSLVSDTYRSSKHLNEKISEMMLFTRTDDILFGAGSSIDNINSHRINKSRQNRENPWREFHIIAAVEVHSNLTQDGNFERTEKTICSMRAHNSGLFEIKPEFNSFGTFRNVKESSNNQSLASSRPYCFTSNSGARYEYSIENLSDFAEKVNNYDECIKSQILSDALKVIRHKQGAGLHISDAPASASRRLYSIIEIQSAACEMRTRMSLKFNLILPPGWISANTSTDWKKTGSGSYIMSGQTQISQSTVSRQSYDICDSNLHLIKSPWKGFPIMLGFLIIFTFHDNRPSISFAILIISIIGMLYSGIALDISKSREMCHFNLPIELDLIYHTKDDTCFGFSGPRLSFELCSIHSFGRRQVEGYGSTFISLKAETNEQWISTWRPIPRLRTQLRDFYVGNATFLNCDNCLLKQYPYVNKHLSIYGLRTEKGSDVLIRMNTIVQGPQVQTLNDFASKNTMDADGKKSLGLVQKMREQLERSKLQFSNDT